MKRLSLFVLFAALTFPLQGFCGLLLEPYVGYASLKDSGTATVGGTAGSIAENTSKGPVFGARVGYSLALFGAGLEYTGGTLDNDGDDVTLTNLGVFASVDLPIIRAWAGYTFSAKAKLDSAGIGSGTFEGTGMKLGVGLSFFPMIDLNLEYATLNFDDEDFATITNLDQDTKGIIVSVSLPLDL